MDVGRPRFCRWRYTGEFLQEPQEDLAITRSQVDDTLGGLQQLASVEL
jgi:hypothetical protein